MKYLDCLLMNKETNHLKLPKLRFPEFQDAKKWDAKKISSICISYSGGTPDTNRKEFYGGDIPFIRSAEINKDETELFLTEEGLKNSSAKLVSKGDILVALYGANSGDVSLAKIDGAINQAILCLKSKASNPFIYQFLSFKKEWIVSTYIQGGQGNLSGDIIKAISLLLPDDVEQKKIADCLTALDVVITAQAGKLKALQDHKKGLMQQLVPAEGETVPKLRFAGFSDEWKHRTLGPFLVAHSERVTSKTDLPIYSSTREGLLPQKDYYNGRELENEGEYGVVPKGYFVYRHMSDDITFKFNINNIFDKIAVSKEYPVFMTRNLDAYFLFYKLNNGDDFKKFAAEQRKGGTRTRLYFKTLCAWGTLIPSLPEQKKIADCLSILDSLISTQSQKLELLKSHKQGLMQQLFPNSNEKFA